MNFKNEYKLVGGLSLFLFISLIVSTERFFLWDEKIFLVIFQLYENIMIEKSMKIVTLLGDSRLWYGILPVFGLYNIKKKYRYNYVFLSIIIACILSDGSIYFLKDYFMRERPLVDLGFINSANTFSFPSGHSAKAFAGFLSITTLMKRNRIFILILPFLVAISRMILGEHYLTDVIAGSLIGYSAYICSEIIIKEIKKREIIPLK